MATKEQSSQWNKRYYQKNREREAARARVKALKTNYGITPEQYDELLTKQKECCAVCGRHHTEFSKRLAVDHDHNTGEIRGLLCLNCNRRVIGRYRRECGLHLLEAAVEYLRRAYTGWFVPENKKKTRRRRRKRAR